MILLAYDLGGRLKDTSRTIEILSSAYDGVRLDALGPRSFNLSYINWHDPILTFDTAPFDVVLGETEYRVQRSVYIYPWLGVMHLELRFPLRAETEPEEVLDFYDQFVAWKNLDYLPYLARTNSMSDSLRMQTSFDAATSRAHIGEIASVVESICILLRDQIHLRPGRYSFHDFRTIFVTGESKADRVDMFQSLLELVPRSLRGGKTTPFSAMNIELSGTKVVSTGWVTVVERPGGVPADQLTDQITLLIRLAHAQWFVCQSWLYLLGREIAVIGPTNDHSRLYELARYKGLFDLDVIEVGNIDLMLKDPRMIRLAEGLVDAFNVSQHRRTAERRFQSVTQAESKRLEGQRTLEAQRLQLLFSISAAVATASLLPVLASTALPIALATIVFATALCIGFIVNTAVLVRNIRRTRIERGLEKRGARGRAMDLAGG